MNITHQEQAQRDGTAVLGAFKRISWGPCGGRYLPLQRPLLKLWRDRVWVASTAVRIFGFLNFAATQPEVDISYHSLIPVSQAL